MGGAENGLTLEGLAQRLEALERGNARLRCATAWPRLGARTQYAIG